MKKNKKFTVIDLFSGIGGLSLGFEKAGFKINLAIDFDKYCELTHKFNSPHIPFLREDLKNLDINKIKPYINGGIDVLIGGPPCQGFSTIGSRVSSDPIKRMKSDPRNILFKEYIKILNFLKPKLFLMENVTGLLTKEKGAIFEDIKNQFKKTGYNFDYVVLNAADFGVPQIRKRVFIYGNKLGKKINPPKSTHGEGKKQYLTVGSAIFDLIDKECSVKNHVPLKHKEINIERYKLIPEGGRLPEKQLDKKLFRKNFGNTFKRLDRNKPSLTMVPGHNAFPIHPYLNRSLTVREAARLQTFDDNFKFFGPRHQQCMQIGNAVPVLLAEKWALNFLKILRNYYKNE